MNDPLNENKEMIINNYENIDINTGNFAKKIYTESVMKRKLLHEIIIYNIKQKQFESRKKFRNKNPKFKKFLHFSVFLNINNRLYISGGKDKEEKCIKDFYSYDYYTNR